jgi:hypothetical protein
MKTILLFSLLALPVFAQQKQDAPPAEPPKFFHFDFAIKEVEGGKVVNLRSYEMILASSGPLSEGSVRTGDKVPVKTGSAGQYTFIDVGINIDCQIQGITGSHLMLHISADISAIDPSSPVENAVMVHQTKWGSAALIPIGKPTTVLSADPPVNKRQLQMEITAKPVP